VDVCEPSLRSIDHFGRLGGEEFVCILPETDLAEAMTCAERMRKSVEDVRIETRDGPLSFTISIGVAVLGPDQEDFSALLKASDDALYRAKNGGRNMVMSNKHN
jgi:diguanylate cyclase (GGDEF)-like protein